MMDTIKKEENCEKKKSEVKNTPTLGKGEQNIEKKEPGIYLPYISLSPNATFLPSFTPFLQICMYHTPDIFVCSFARRTAEARHFLFKLPYAYART